MIEGNISELSRLAYTLGEEGQGLRTPNWKYIRWNDGGQELFNLTADPGERENLVSAFPSVVNEFEEVLNGYNTEKTISKYYALEYYERFVD